MIGAFSEGTNYTVVVAGFSSQNQGLRSEREREHCLFGRYPCKEHDKQGNTVRGRNPAPVEVGSLSHYLQGFSTIPGGVCGFLNHQQYHPFQVSQRPAPSSRRIISISQSPVGMSRYIYIYISPFNIWWFQPNLKNMLVK